MVATLSASSLSPYQLPAPIPMHPRAMGNTEGPRVPSLTSFVVFMSRTLRSDFEVAPALEIGDETRLVWAPPKPLSRLRARGRKVEREETREPGEVRGGLLGGLRDDRHVQASPDGGRRTSDARTPRDASASAARSAARRCATGEPESGASSSVPTRPSARTPIPDVTTKGRPDPASAAPIASIASLSVSPAAARFE